MVTMLAVFALAQHSAGSGEQKPLSPPAKAEATIGGQAVTIAYNAPSARGRKIYYGLVPSGEVWRTGANEATTLTTAGDLLVGTVKVPKGTYTVFTIPAEKGWILILSKRLKDANGKPAWGAYEYDASQDLGRTEMKVEALKAPVETFTISVANGKLTMDWENTRASVDIKAAK
ncbi:MAG: DUF2911 domain-containing protein [Acidobacteriales bacterium]|nr:DUF2911 domain-containing protein [Terriglobales bacterium]